MVGAVNLSRQGSLNQVGPERHEAARQPANGEGEAGEGQAVASGGARTSTAVGGKVAAPIVKPSGPLSEPAHQQRTGQRLGEEAGRGLALIPAPPQLGWTSA